MFYNYSFEDTREIVCDVFVAGGGISGASAAIASARQGALTVMAEESGTLGGQAGCGLVTPLSSTKSRKGESFGGLAQELEETVSHLTRKYVCEKAGSGKVYTVSPHITKYVLLKKAVEAGVDVRFHTLLCDVEVNENNIEYVLLKDKNGYIKVKANSYIDATGDGELIYLSGDDYVLGSESGIFEHLEKNNLDKVHFSEKNGEKYGGMNLMQPVSMFFVMRGVDYETACKFNNKQIRFGEYGITKERFLNWEFCNTPGFEITGDYLPTPQNRILISRGRSEDEAVVNMSRIININGSDADDLTKGEIQAQLQLIAIVDFLKSFVPGFENSYMTESSTRLGVRETRRLCGRYKLSGTEIIKGKSFADPICRGYYLIDIHDPQGKSGAIGGEIQRDYYEIPFGAIMSAKYDNLLACGRCISCDHIAHSATRIQGTCILTGQAAGCASALARKLNKKLCDVDYAILRSALENAGVKL